MYSYKKQTNKTYSKALKDVQVSLKKQGFGIITRIDIQKTFKEKIGKNVGKYTILGACNPTFAYESLKEEKDIGLLLPCNVIVYEEQENTYIACIKPTVAMDMVQNPTILTIAIAVEKKLKRAINEAIK